MSEVGVSTTTILCLPQTKAILTANVETVGVASLTLRQLNLTSLHRLPQVIIFSDIKDCLLKISTNGPNIKLNKKFKSQQNRNVLEISFITGVIQRASLSVVKNLQCFALINVSLVVGVQVECTDCQKIPSHAPILKIVQQLVRMNLLSQMKTT